MGGEHGGELGQLGALAGSPPHGRGTRRGARRGGPAAGLTPAWAGNTTSASRASPHTTAHPRMGGEHSQRSADVLSAAGSPPHGRGTPGATPAAASTQRLTPAWAGNTSAIRALRSPAEAHPRMGGEHREARPCGVHVVGSPPHGRGTPAARRPRRRGRGLTPAWAGNTATTWTALPARRAHPRMGGEHHRLRLRRPVRLGSPPHGRGTLARPRPRRMGSGLTPAWAGNTEPEGAAAAVTSGSPPHGRGTRDAVAGLHRQRGLTPAWAGNTACRPAPTRPREAHPRMGGEHLTGGCGRC